jgi:hypothetical protein
MVTHFHGPAPQHVQETPARPGVEMGDAAQGAGIEQVGVDPEPLEQAGQAIECDARRGSGRRIRTISCF